MRDLSRHHRLLIVVCLMLPTPWHSAVHAETYSYEGENYTDVQGGYDTTMSTSGSFTVLGSLDPGMPLTDISSLVSSYSFFDGLKTLDQNNSEIVQFEVATDAECRLVLWTIAFWDVDPSPIPGFDTIDGIDLYASELEMDSRDDGFINAICESPCPFVIVESASSYGLVDYDPPGDPSLWTEPASCPGFIFQDGFESGDLGEWSSSVP